MGKIGDMQVSRILLGGNLLTHFTHSRDLKYVYTLAAHYNTDEKILETLAIAEAQGLNTVSMHNPPHPISLLKRYRKERGGEKTFTYNHDLTPNPPLGIGTYVADAFLLVGGQAQLALHAAQEFEAHVAAYCGVPYAVGLSSGSRKYGSG